MNAEEKIKCKSGNCIYGLCCIECDGQKSEGHQCGCILTEDCLNKEEILADCKYAYVSTESNEIKEDWYIN